ncbi:MAG: anaerobic ribonucleoside-triphosphate reductase activating protein [Emergencia sp.]|nr:anaerobic ribonucleoside-triphosphate reductase activating protein [Emergencia sp.]
MNENLMNEELSEGKLTGEKLKCENEKKKSIRIAGVVKESIVDGPGIRFVVFCQGCPHHCPGCHNAVTHDFEGGYDCAVETFLAAIDENPLLSGVTFSGGEPACQPEGFAALAEELKVRNLNIIMYSGYTFEELLEKAEKEKALAKLLSFVDILVDGRYREVERDLTLLFRGSRNQRVIDVPNSLKQGKTVLSDKF